MFCSYNLKVMHIFFFGLLFASIFSGDSNAQADATYEYTVVAGDTLSDIAFLRMGTPIFTEGGTLDQLLKLNPKLTRFTKLTPGSRVIISKRRRKRGRKRSRKPPGEFDLEIEVEEDESISDDIPPSSAEERVMTEHKFTPDLKITWGIGNYSLDQVLNDTGEHFNMWGTTFDNVTFRNQMVLSNRVRLDLGLQLFSYHFTRQMSADYMMDGSSLTVFNPSVGIRTRLASTENTSFTLVTLFLLEASPLFAFASNTMLTFENTVNLAPSIRFNYRMKVREKPRHISYFTVGAGFETILYNFNSDLSLNGFPNKEIFIISFEHQFANLVAFVTEIDLAYKHWSWTMMGEQWSQRYLSTGIRIGLAFSLP